LNFFDVFVTCCFKNYELMSYDSICDLLVLGGVELEGLGDLVDLGLAA